MNTIEKCDGGAKSIISVRDAVNVMPLTGQGRRSRRMNAKELASLIDGCEYGRELTPAIEEQARQAGLVIVFGASDDLMEFSGAISDEADVYEGGVVMLDVNGVVRAPDCDLEFRMCPYYESAIKHCKKIKAVWCPKDTYFAWVYETDIPHEVFRVFEDGEHYCLGIVFSVEDLK